MLALNLGAFGTVVVDGEAVSLRVFVDDGDLDDVAMGYVDDRPRLSLVVNAGVEPVAVGDNRDVASGP